MERRMNGFLLFGLIAATFGLIALVMTCGSFHKGDEFRSLKLAGFTSGLFGIVGIFYRFYRKAVGDYKDFVHLRSIARLRMVSFCICSESGDNLAVINFAKSLMQNDAGLDAAAGATEPGPHEDLHVLLKRLLPPFPEKLES